jgi:hypothetical protein
MPIIFLTYFMTDTPDAAAVAVVATAIRLLIPSDSMSRLVAADAAEKDTTRANLPCESLNSSVA